MSNNKDNTALRLIKKIWHEQSVLFALILLIIVGTLVNSMFLTGRNLSNILRQVSVSGIISMGMTIVIISGGIDLSVGSVLALSGVVAMIVLNATGSIMLCLVTAFGMGLLIGCISGLLVTRGRIAPFIATLGMMTASRSLALFFISGGAIVGTNKAFMLISNSKLFGLRLPIYYFAVVAVIMHLIMTRTKFGRYVYSIGSNEKASILSAINVKKIKMQVYLIIGFLVSIAAVIEGSTLNSISSSSSGSSYEMDAIAAVIIGGTRLDGGKGTIIGTILGVLMLGVLNNILNLMNMSPFLQGFVKGVIIIVAVLLQKKND